MLMLNAAAVGPQRHSLPRVDFSPADIVKHGLGYWRGVHAETIQVIRRERLEYRFKNRYHLLVAIENGTRYDGELLVEGLPIWKLRNCSHKLILVPAGRCFAGWQWPRQLTRSMFLYIDPMTVTVDPNLRFDEADLEPRMLFDDGGIWQTIAKLKGLIGNDDPAEALYAEALGGVLAHELLRLQGRSPASRPPHRGGLAGWQQRRITEFIQAHLADSVSLEALAEVVRLSPYHFARSFKQSFGEPPHRYWTSRRIERAKILLADRNMSIIEIALAIGFGSASSFSSAFRRIAGLTPTDYRRVLE